MHANVIIYAPTPIKRSYQVCFAQVIAE